MENEERRSEEIWRSEEEVMKSAEELLLNFEVQKSGLKFSGWRSHEECEV